MSIQIPKELMSESYLVRAEIISLHKAELENLQIFVSCAQIFLRSTGNLVPTATVSIPGIPYPEPPIAALIPSSINFSSIKTQSEGIKPSNCIYESGNWCGIDVPSYSNQTSCWKVSLL